MRDSNLQNAGTLGLPKAMRQKFKDLRALAEFSFPNGSIIRCSACSIERHCTTEEIADWIKNGYPNCRRCGRKTELTNPHVRQKGSKE